MLGALSVVLVVGLFGRACPAQQEDLARALPRLQPTAAELAQSGFQTLPGFRVKLLAAEPLVNDPVAAAFDAHGRLFVAEMSDYPFQENRPDGRIRELIDGNGDGWFESSRVYLDKLGWPTGLTPWRGGFFVLAPPDLIYARDHDGDGIAEDRRVVYTGFGLQNVQSLANNLTWGQDGWIYGASGGNGGTITRPDAPDWPAVVLSNNDFRFHPDTRAFEIITGGGQFGLTFDDWGRRLVCSNSHHILQVLWERAIIERNPHASLGPAVLDIGLDGAAAPVFRISPPEPWRVVRTRRRVADPSFVQRIPSTELTATGYFTSATGITVYRGAAFPNAYRGNIFVGDVGGNLVHRKQLVPAGAVFQAVRVDEGREFLASRDNWFRPVNFGNTPNGTLLVLDMYRETIEHPDSIPDDIKAHLDLVHGKTYGRVYELVPAGTWQPARSQLDARDPGSLLQALASPHGWTRDTAQRLILEQADPKTSDSLRELLRSQVSGVSKAQIARTLDALGGLNAGDLTPLLRDTDPNLRVVAVRLAGRGLIADPEVYSAVASLHEDPSPEVRFHAALVLGGLEEGETIPPLVRFAALSREDPWMRLAIATGLRGRALAFAKIAANLGIFEGAGGDAWIDTVGALIGAESDVAAITEFLDLVGAGRADRTRLRRALRAVGQGRARVGASIGALATSGGRLEGLMRELLTEAVGVVGDPERPLEERIEAARFLEFGPAELAVATVLPRLGGNEPLELQIASIRVLSRSGDPRAAPALIAAWEQLGVASRREAIEFLMSRPETTRVLLQAIREGLVVPGELDAARRARLRAHENPEIRASALEILGPSDPDRASLVARYQQEIAGAGIIERGRELVERHCLACHEPQGNAPALAPSLDTVASRSVDDLVLHILDPNREVAPAMMMYVVSTKDGRVVSGLLASESGGTIVLRRAEGAQDEIPRSEVESIRSTGLSLMPEGLENDLNPRDLADIIAFLRRPRGADGPGHP